jgi:EpsI family protein
MSTMARSAIKNWLVLALMVLCASAAAWMSPKTYTADQQQTVNLAELVPRSFGDWTELRHTSQQIINPQLAAQLQATYTETLTRSYVNSSGEVVMLSIAYGASQSRNLQVHRPEVCYAAQGFQVRTTGANTLNTNSIAIPVQHLMTQLGPRHEPVSYWVRIGNQFVLGQFKQSLARIRHGLSGQIPDGVLVRASSISQDPQAAYPVHQAFMQAMVGALSSSARLVLIGG